VKDAPQDGGLPWRTLPGYSSTGSLRRTSSHSPSPEGSRRELGGTLNFKYRGVGQCSPRLSGGAGMRELLEPVEEDGCDPSKAPQASCVSPGSPCSPTLDGAKGRSEASCVSPGTPYSPMLEGAKKRSEASCVSPGSPRSPQLEWAKRRLDAKLDRQQTPGLTDDSEKSFHWQYRQQKKQVVPKEGAKEGCPYNRDDAPPIPGRLQTPIRRTSLSPRSSLGLSMPRLCGPEPIPVWEYGSEERIPDARRDYGFVQAQQQEGCVSPTSRDLDTSSSSLASFRRTASVKSFTASTISALEHPVHSVKPRPNSVKPGRPQWR